VTAADDSPAIRGFVDYFGGLGARWGLPAEACRVHAFLYLAGSPADQAQIGDAIELSPDAVGEAIAFLVDYRMVQAAGPGAWATGDDPWEMLTSGLAERRRREVEPGLATLRECHRLAAQSDRGVALRIGKLLTLAEDLAALEMQARRVSPQVLRGLLGLSSRAARLLTRSERSGGRTAS
jgi:DNA-binding transcriptional regulator GbsR (MarR family)